MRYRWARWTLLVVAVIAAVGACGLALDLERQLREVRAGLGAVEARAVAARVALNDVRRALAAMATPGQAAVGWSRRAAAAIEDAGRQMAGLPPPSPAAGAAAPRDGDLLDRLGEAERRVREHAVGGKALIAADVAFGEAMPIIDELDRRVADGVEAGMVGADRDMATLRDRQVAALAGALAGLLLAAVILTPLPRARQLDPAPAADGDAPAPPLAPVPDVVPLAPAVAVEAPARQPRVDLQALAGACSALSLVADADALPAALERVAAALGAHGVIAWLADPDRRQLRAAATSGYERRLVERLGAVDVAGDNPTAKAFRTAKPVISPARNSRAGSIAVPIIGTAGVTGVLSAELTATDPTTLPEVAAAAGVVAAQLAGLLAPAAVPVVALDEAAGGAPV